MKVLFVSSGNSGSVSPIVKAQGKSLEEIGINVSYFLIEGKGFWGYLKNIPRLRKYLNINEYDVIHAHYSLTGYVATMAKAKPIVVSLMGSDVKRNGSIHYLLNYFCNSIWNAVIVKSKDMKKYLGYDHICIIPNGVDVDKFKPRDKVKSQNRLDWEKQKIQLLFAADPARKEKNYDLFKQSIKKLRLSYGNIGIKYLRDVDMDKVPVYMNASDVVCLSSKWEGSPNVIKEAMACNRPIVSTNVGDIEWLFGNIDGHYICDFDAIDVAKKLAEAIKYSKAYKYTSGRSRIFELGLDSKIIADKILKVYRRILKQ